MTKKLTTEQVLDAVEKYKSGLTLREVGCIYGVSAQAIRGLMNRRGINARNLSECQRQYTCNHSFFAHIDSERKSYWLGFIAADGYIDRNALSLTLHQKDRSHILKLKDDLESTHPVIDYKYDYSSPFSKLYIRSSQLTADLSSWGIIPKKSLTLCFPEKLNKSLLKDFIRGCVDGDGSFSFYQSRPAHTTFTLTGSKNLVESVQSVLINMCGLKETKLDQRRSCTPVFTLRYTGNEQVSRIHDYLYRDATVFLERKKFAPFLTGNTSFNTNCSYSSLE